jgi:DNA-binding SARP family transcriptional activator/regulation of enolase protein 1 (concanavalin A-like superfamily)
MNTVSSNQGPGDTDGPVSIRLLGGFAIRLGSHPPEKLPTQKCEQLLAYLALHPGENHLRRLLASTFWLDQEEKAALGSLRTALMPVRRLFQPWEAQGYGIQRNKLHVAFLPPPGCRVDALEFQQLAREGLNRLLSAEERIPRLEAALRTHADPFLAGCDAEWCEPIRGQLQVLYFDCLQAVVEAHKACRRPARVVEWARVGLFHEPYDESLHREIMYHLHLMGDRVGMMHQFLECRRLLSEEGLETEPSPETVALYEELLRSTPIPVATPSQRLLQQFQVTGPLTGRAREMETLCRAWAAARQGSPQLRFVSGDAGIGKSRLGQELLRRVEADQGLAVYGQAYGLDRGTLYEPIIDALRAVQRLAQTRSLRLGQPGALVQAARLLPSLRQQFPDLPQPSTDDERDLFAGLSRFFLDLARQQPLCLFLDDLHWADDASLRFLHYLWRHAENAPLLLVGAYRDVEGRENALLMLWRREAELRQPGGATLLGPLTEEATEELLAHLSGHSPSLPAGFSRRLHQETEGHPLFLQYTLQTLFDVQYLTANAAGQWQPGPEFPGLASLPGEAGSRDRETTKGALDPGLMEPLPLSPTIRQSILGQLERFQERERHLLEVAAVLGPPIDPDILATVAEQKLERTLLMLDRLLQLHLLRDAPDGKFAFSHDRVRDVVYDSLSSPRRQLLHLGAGRALAARFGEQPGPHTVAIATHFLQAPQARGAEPAARYLIAAGARARSLSAHAEAVRRLETALELLDDLAENETRLKLRGDAIHSLFHAYRGLGQADQANRVLQEYLDRCRQARYPAGEARVCTWIAQVLVLEPAVQREGPEASRLENLCRRAIDLCQRHGFDDWINKPRLVLAFYYWRLRPDLAKQEALVVEVLPDLERLDAHDAQLALTQRIAVHAARDCWEEAHSTFLRSLDYGGPDPLYFSLLLAEWQARLEEEGRGAEYEAVCRTWQKGILAESLHALPCQWRLEKTEPAVIALPVLLDTCFDAEALPEGVRWVDPLGIATPTLRQGEGLRLAPPTGPNLWTPFNLNAPRLLSPVAGDFVVETRVDIGKIGEQGAGLLVWQDEQQFLRLMLMRSSAHRQGIFFEGCLDGTYRYLGLGRYPADQAWLRVERSGPDFHALCSKDRQRWLTCGRVRAPMSREVEVGAACIAYTDGSGARFERLTVRGAPNEGSA